MATPIHGSIGSFDSSQEDWLSYTEHLQQYFTANNIADDEASAAKKRAILLSVCGAETFRLIKSLLAPVKPETKTFEQIVALVEKHHNPEPSATIQRYKFHSRCRQPGETVSQYVAELRRIAEHCKFGDNLESALCDRLVCGIQDSQIQRRLLGEPDLKFPQAFNLAQSLESADRDTKALQAAPARVNAVNASHFRNAKKPDRPCYCCGGPHFDRDCRFKDAECRKCKKKGHIACACRSKPASQPAAQKPVIQKSQSRQPRRQQTNLLTEEFPEDADSDADTDPVYSLFTVSHRTAKPLRVDVELNQTSLSMEVDTGASVSVISKDTYKKLWLSARAPPLESSDVQLQTYTGQSLPVLGTIHVDVAYKNQSAELPLVVVEGHGPSLFGRDWLQHINLDWKTLNMVQAKAQTLSAVLNNHKAVFSDELGVIRGTSAKLIVDPQTRPRSFKYRRKPRSTLDLIKPNIADRVRHNQQKQKAGHDQGTVQRSFDIGAPVFVKNFASGPVWLPGRVTNTKGSCSYEVELSDGRIVCRHGDHIRLRTAIVDQTDTVTDTDDPLMDVGVPPQQTVDEPPEAANDSSSAPVLRRSTRNRRPPDRFRS